MVAGLVQHLSMLPRAGFAAVHVIELFLRRSQARGDVSLQLPLPLPRRLRVLIAPSRWDRPNVPLHVVRAGTGSGEFAQTVDRDA